MLYYHFFRDGPQVLQSTLLPLGWPILQGLLFWRPLDLRDLLGGLWELPGGKRESGESLKNGLKREIKEELSIDIEIDKKIGMIQHSYSHMKIKLHGYYCRVHSGKMPKAKEVDDRKLASMTEGFSGAEIKSAVLEAGISAISDNRKSVNKDDFILAIKKVQENRNTSSDSNSEGIYT